MKKLKLVIILPLLILCLGIFACSLTDVPVFDPSESNNAEATAITVQGGVVYVAGSYVDSEGRGIPCYWKDGNRIDLPIPTDSAKAFTTGIAVWGNTVYTSGYYLSRDRGYISCYWENDDRTDFRDYSFTTAITVQDGITYVTGWYGNGNGWYGNGNDLTRTACYWVNGNITDLPVPQGAGSAEATCIAVKDGKVYIGGSYMNSPNPNTSLLILCYWVNGIITDLTNPAEIRGTETNSIDVQDGIVYVCGMYEKTFNKYVAGYWVNGNITDLPVPNGIRLARATDISVQNSTVYISGKYLRSSDLRDVSCYWVNGLRTDLPTPTVTIKINAVDTETTGIAVQDGTVYTSGWYWDMDRCSIACYWVNGTRVELITPIVLSRR